MRRMVKMNKIVKYINLRIFEYLYINLILMLKLFKEYKSNVLIQIITQVLYFMSYFILFYIVSSKLNLTTWSTFDFFFYIIIIDTIVTFSGIFLWKLGLKQMITTGSLSQYIVRPISPFVGFQLSNLSINGFIQFLCNMCIFIFLLNSDLVNFSFVLVDYFIMILISIFYILVRLFSASVNFFSFGLSHFLYFEFFKSASSSFKMFPSPFFNNFPYQKFLFIFPNFYIGSILFNHMETGILNIKFILILISLILFLICFIIFNWKYGLKKYEAYG